MAKKQKVQPAPKQVLQLLSTAYVDVTREGDPDDQWDRDSTSTSWTVSGVRLTESSYEHDFMPDFDVKVGDTVWVVYAVYSTGDSFGSDEGARLEVLSMHKNRENAYYNQLAAQNAKKELLLKFDSNKTLKMSCIPWDGYFESLDYVSVDSFIVC